MGTRVERDSMGEILVPDTAYYGAQTQRAVENFPISGLSIPTGMIRALGMIKKAAAKVNLDLGLLDRERAEAVMQAAQEVIDGKFDDQFPIDVFQTGSGTSSNMNANEVIGNRASEIMGGQIGTREPVHPNDHVNKGQSSNDVIPTAIHVAAAVALSGRLIPALKALYKALDEKARAFDHVLKIGRTHLQDATPIRLGQEFSGYAAMVKSGVDRLTRAGEELGRLAIGGTAVGTGINTHVEFGSRMAKELSKLTGLKFVEAPNHFEAQAAFDGAVEVSGTLKTVAVSLSKIANDIRWLGSGPRAGLGELKLPAVQPGSSIMPGKVNPVICEAMIQTCAQVIGNDATIAHGGLGSFFELTLMLPLVARSLLESIEFLAGAATMFREKLVEGLEADEQKCADYIEGSLAMCTALAPVIGYDAAAAIAKEAYQSGKTVREVAREKGLVSEEELTRLLDPMSMTKPKG
ncbi:MAG: aspartate ammonia-lyase [Calditrichaeota bacterium]|nr:aspartate ammonia-lyase [Calditrichota bacterium]